MSSTSVRPHATRSRPQPLNLHSPAPTLARIPYWLLSAIVLLALLLRLPNLTESVWNDELAATRLRLDNPLLLIHTIRLELLPPLYFLLMFIWIRLFGDSELSVRIPSLIFGLLCIPLVYVLARDVTRQTTTALLAALLVAASPVHIWYSQEARPYSGLLLCLLLAVFSYHRFHHSQSNTGWFVLYCATISAAVFSHYYIIVYAALFSLLCFLYRHAHWYRITLANMIFSAGVVSFLMIKFQGYPPVEVGYLRAFDLAELWTLWFNWFLMGNSLWNLGPYTGADILGRDPAMLAVQLAAFAVFVRGLMSMLRELAESAAVVLYLICLPAGLLVGTLLGFEHIYIERSLFVTLPFFYIILARGATGLRWKALTVACVAGVMCLNTAVLWAFFMKDLEWTVYKPNPDWRSITAYLNGEMTDAEVPAPIFATSASAELVYYDRRFRDRRMLHQRHLPDEDSAGGRAVVEIVYVDGGSDVCESVVTSGARRFFLLRNWYWERDFGEVWEAIMRDERCQLMRRQSFKAMDVYTFGVQDPRS